MQLFAALELLMALRGLSWHAQGRSGTQNGAQKEPKSGPKVVQKLFKNLSQKWSRKGPKKWSPKSIALGGFFEVSFNMLSTGMVFGEQEAIFCRQAWCFVDML